MERIIFHIDVNNAFLSWSAVYLLNNGSKIDIRKIPSIIGGDESKRHGIVLAKSPVAKKMGIVTAETLYSARKKCPNLAIYEPNFTWYYKESNLLYDYLCQYTPTIERFSIDECFLDMTGTNLLYKDYLSLAYNIKDDIKEKFGFTVNIGIANNMLCAKMASDFEKPDKVHTLFMNEIKEKMWPLPINDLFMVGKATTAELLKLNIKTIGALANTNMTILKRYFKNQALFLHNYANGIDTAKVTPRSSKSESISTTQTLPYDYTDAAKLKEILFLQAEEIGRSLRLQKQYAETLAIIYKNNLFENYTRQAKFAKVTNTTKNIYDLAVTLLDSTWKGDPIRLIGLRVSNFKNSRDSQISIFDKVENKDDDTFQELLDTINNKFGNNSVMPASIKKITNKIDSKKKN
jgi:DNA polymerase-4